MGKMTVIAKTAICTCIFIFISLRSVANAKLIAETNLQDDLEDFQKLIPTKEIVMLILRYIEEDEEFSEVIKYLLSDEFLRLVFFIDCTPEYINILKYVEFAGLPIHKYINTFYRFLSLPEYSLARDIQRFQINCDLGGLRFFFKNIIKLLPFEKILILFQKKIKTSVGFKNFVMKIKDKRFVVLINAFTDNWKFKEFLRRVKKKIDTEAIREFIDCLINIDKQMIHINC